MASNPAPPVPQNPIAIDGGLIFDDMADVRAKVEELKAIGYDGIYSFEGSSDGFMPFVIAAEHTETQLLSTQVAVAFARNPLTLAYQANDLQMLSKGRFILGMGTQAKPNIEKRFSMPWGKPVTRMRDMIGAIRAIQRTWQTGEPLNYQGEYYRHTKMQPLFTPKPNPYGPPPLMLGAIGAPMTRAAGELADWFVVIPFCTEKFVRETTFPALEEGLEKGGRTWDDLKIAAQCMIATGADERAYAEAIARTRYQIAFYGSTPIYAKALEAEGWGDLHPTLHQMTRENRWLEMGQLITDEMCERFAVVGEPHEIGPKLVERFGGWVDRLSIMTTYQLQPEVASRIVSDVRERTASRGS
ncbi:MAG: TIGR03617 family F420-dependent LLM class oxidoreductase [Polyangiales bacterium]